MKLKTFVRIWIGLTILLVYECYALNNNTYISIFAILKENTQVFHRLNLSPAPGRTISLWYGWAGISLMLLTNLYILRKRFRFLGQFGQVSGWLDFHIFCGLLGPTFILFHTNFKVGGLVAISFWSMVISFSSGIVGRYFYMQLLREKSDLEKDAEIQKKKIKNLLPTIPEEEFQNILDQSLKLAGANSNNMSIFGAIVSSFAGDLRLAAGGAKLIYRLPFEGEMALKGFAKNTRKANYLTQFQAVMGYWHSFHMPFAVFMYIVAAIHIATALLLGVSNQSGSYELESKRQKTRPAAVQQSSQPRLPLHPKSHKNEGQQLK